MKSIPIKSAKDIADEYDAPEVVIFAYDPDTGKQHVTTYGKSLEQSKDAARAGNWLKTQLGWPKGECNSVSLKELQKPIDDGCYERGLLVKNLDLKLEYDHDPYWELSIYLSEDKIETYDTSSGDTMEEGIELMFEQIDNDIQNIQLILER